MPWGGCLPVSSESCLDLYAVSVVRPDPISVTPPAPNGISATDGSFTDRVRVSWTASDGAVDYKVFRHTTNSTTGAKELTNDHPASPYEDDSAVPDVTYFYWVQACNSAGCSDYSLPDTGYAAGELTPPSEPTGVDASDGTYMDKVRISWDQTEGAAYYQVFRTENNSSPMIGDSPIADYVLIPTFDDFTAEENSTYYYWLNACNFEGCSGFSESDDGWREANNVYLPLILR